MRRYSIWAELLDLDDPSQVIGRLHEPILTPDEHERDGYVPNVVFSCGAVPEDDGSVTIYWGGADTVMCAGTAQIADLVEFLYALTDPTAIDLRDDMPASVPSGFSLAE